MNSHTNHIAGGTFIVHLYTAVPATADELAKIQQHLLWDRKAEGGFPGATYLPSKSPSSRNSNPLNSYPHLHLHRT